MKRRPGHRKPSLPSPLPESKSDRIGVRRSLLYRGRWLLVAAVVVSAIAAAIGFASRLGPRRQPLPESEPFPLAPISSSPFLNTAAEVGYVGSEACRSCHVGTEASFRRTGMGRSMAEVAISREPPDAVFDHPASMRRYQVLRKDGQLWHRELLLTRQVEEVVLSEHPLKYVVGSGRHSLTYLVETEGFLVESPLTWYASRQAWGMSPGYDNSHQVGFERAADEGCLICHAGQFKSLDGSAHRMHVGEAAIACENCHGPGALHVARHAGRERATARPLGDIDLTIVNPSHLSRGLAEAVCQQCHLRSNATVVARGRSPFQFRPGLPLQDFRHDYRLDLPDSSMKVVGHVEQMHLSRCYKSTDSLTCMTCHNPHGEPRPKDAVTYYNSICLDCHRPERCSVAEVRRLKESPENDCVSCHMPRSPTNIPHLAFTHHRIGIHDPAPAKAMPSGPASDVLGELQPLLDLPKLTDADRKRSLGLGYLEAANLQPGSASAGVYRKRALDLLARVKSSGLKDPVVDVALARLHFDLGLGDAMPFAESALANGDLAASDRCTALLLLADAHALQGRHAEAVAELRRLTQLRRHSGDWLLLADCERALGNQPASLGALEQAIRINPRLWKVHRHLAQHYRRQGNLERATWHEKRAVEDGP